MMDILRRLRDFALSQRLLSPGDRLLVAVSGGPDSVALLHLLCDLSDVLGLHLEVAHLQHGMRGEEGREDARFVGDLAESMQLTFHLKDVDLPAIKRDAGKGNLEALARAERHRFFAEVVRQRRLGKVVTAHTLDDQAETLLMWLLRGAGLKGLGGIAPRREIVLGGNRSNQALVLIRPLLATAKAELLQYLSDRQLAYRVDRSNQDPAFLRNWIRRELLPLIGQRVDGRVPERLGNLAELVRDEDAYLEELARERLADLSAGDGLDRGGFLEQPRALRRRMLRQWIDQARRELSGLEFVHIEDMLRLIEQGPPQGRVSMPGDWELERQYQRLRVKKRRRERPRACYNYRLEIGSVLAVPEAQLQIFSKTVAGSRERPPADRMEAQFDLAALAGNLWVRNFRPGDRFQPFGMSGHKKVKDLFIEKRVPLALRARWPLVLCGEQIIWIPGYGRSEAGRVGLQTSAVLELKARPISS